MDIKQLRNKLKVKFYTSNTKFLMKITNGKPDALYLYVLKKKKKLINLQKKRQKIPFFTSVTAIFYKFNFEN